MALRRGPRTDPLLSSKNQTGRLLLLVALLAFMLYGVYWAAQAQHWRWVTRDKPPVARPH